MKFVLLISLKLLTNANSFLLNIPEHENFSANKFEKANYCLHFHVFTTFWTLCSIPAYQVYSEKSIALKRKNLLPESPLKGKNLLKGANSFP